MPNLNRRLKMAESKLNVDKERRVVEIVWFGDGPVPSDEIQDNRTIRYVKFDDVIQRNKNEKYRAIKATKNNEKQWI